jgi:mRNA interferase MazF
MKRGEVWWADLAAPAGRRPVLLVSRDEAYAVRELVTVAPVTTRARGIPSEVPLGKKDGLPKACVANLDNLTTIPKQLLESRITALTAAKVDAVDDAIAFALGL